MRLSSAFAKSLIAPVMALLCAAPAFARDFFDVSQPDETFNIGVRLGVNTSNRTVGKDVFSMWNKNAWGTGFDAGVVANINLRDWATIQPGFFFETRSGNYTYISGVPSGVQQMPTRISTVGGEFVQVGHNRRYSFNIPILFSAHFNLSDAVRWSLDLGPYFAFTFKNDDNKAVYFPDIFNTSTREVKPANFDFGFKMGTGINVLTHYYFGIHYMAGTLHPWKDAELGGCNKAWTFTIGYDF